MFYISRVKLENIRGFRELDISFLSSGDSVKDETRRWTVLLGDNATGKTTLLRCIAFGLCDESSAAGLVSDRPETFVRQNEGEGIVYVELSDEEGAGYCTIGTKISSHASTGEQVEQKVLKCKIDVFDWEKEGNRLSKTPWDSLFVAGYGAGRIPDGGAKYDEYRINDAVYTLFDYQQLLQEPELGWRRLLDNARKNPGDSNERDAEKRMDDQIKELLRDVLVLRHGESISLEPTGIRVEGPGYSVPLSSHSDGYRATAVWLLDLISWRMLYDKGLDPRSMRGIVLIDEIEQHLHPRWQRYIIDRLHSQFPEVQFIATTHSPLCAAGSADLSDDECQLIGLSRAETEINNRVLDLPRGYRADQILTAEGYFDLDDSRNLAVGNKVERYRELFRKSPDLDSKEKTEFEELRQFVNEAVPDVAQLEEDRKVRDELRDLIKRIDSQTEKGNRS